MLNRSWLGYWKFRAESCRRFWNMENICVGADFAPSPWGCMLGNNHRQVTYPQGQIYHLCGRGEPHNDLIWWPVADNAKMWVQSAFAPSVLSLIFALSEQGSHTYNRCQNKEHVVVAKHYQLSGTWDFKPCFPGWAIHASGYPYAYLGDQLFVKEAGRPRKIGWIGEHPIFLMCIKRQ